MDMGGMAWAMVVAAAEGPDWGSKRIEVVVGA
jgi:hypothetical protein